MEQREDGRSDLNNINVIVIVHARTGYMRFLHASAKDIYTATKQKMHAIWYNLIRLAAFFLSYHTKTIECGEFK